MHQSGKFTMWGQKLINIIIHKEDVVRIAPIKNGGGCIIYLKNQVPYQVRESEQEVYRRLNWVTV
jgi:hypothetical protein